MNAEYTGRQIAQLRKQKGLTQRELAVALHVTDKAVSKWERGLNYPDIALLEQLALVLDCSVLVLLGLEDARGEEIAGALSQLSTAEKARICREFRWRGWLTVALSLLAWAAALYASWVLAQHQIFGLPQVATGGMSGFLAILLANGIFSVRKSRFLS